MNQREATQLTLEALPGTFNIHRCAPDAAVPSAVLSAPLFSVLRSELELSIVCDAAIEIAASQHVGPWCALRVAGTLDFALTGILSRLASALAAAEISVFAISSFDTDYLLIRLENQAAAHETLRKAGYLITIAT